MFSAQKDSFQNIEALWTLILKGALLNLFAIEVTKGIMPFNLLNIEKD